MSMELALKLWKMGHPNILVIGDAILDRDLHGMISRQADEAPGCPVFIVERQEERWGGAEGVGTMVRALKADCAVVRAVACSVKYRHFVQGQQVWRHDEDANREWTADLSHDVKRCLSRADCVLVVDCGKGACSPGVLRAAIDGAREKGIPCIVDPHGNRNWSDYRGLTALKCNESEWDRFITAVGRYYGLALVTQGEKGAACYAGPPEQYPARPRNVVATCGAGDMVLAALGVCLAAGLTWPEACTVAVAASGLKVERPRAVPVSRAEVCLDLCHGTKVLPLDLLPAVREAAKARKQTVAFTNGCFDVLHRGHLHLLEAARASADLLVVGVDDDEAVRHLKGPSRPVVPLEGRLALLAGLSCVDWVVSYSGANPTPLALALMPTVLVKGQEYEGKVILGAEHAGRVLLVPMLPGLSTTVIIGRGR